VPRHGGCDFPVDPDIPAPDAQVLWEPEIAPAVTMHLAPVPVPTQGCLRISARDLTIIVDQGDTRIARLSCGAVVVMAAAPISHPIGILLPLDAHWSARLAQLERHRALLLGRSTPDTTLTALQRSRIRLALRVNDGRASSDSYQTIAREVFGDDAVAREHWKTSSIKARVARLSAYGRHLTRTGYRALLLGQSPATPAPRPA
jgi:hypothetical protein